MSMAFAQAGHGGCSAPCCLPRPALAGAGGRRPRRRRRAGRAGEPRPALWLLADADTTIYLFGTVHILPPGFRWRSPAIDGAIRDADELVLEVDERDMMARSGDARSADDARQGRRRSPGGCRPTGARRSAR